MIGPAGFQAAPTVERPAFGTALIRCTRSKCSFRGYETDLVGRPHKSIASVTQNVCPACGCDSYYTMTPKEIAAWEKKQAKA